MSASLEPNFDLCGHVFAQLDALKAKLGNRFIIGLSGGGDSMALAHLCAAWAQRSGASVQALCVDHGFRPEAACEARQACDWVRALGFDATIHTHKGPIPTTGLQAYARNLRQGVLAQAAHKAGGATILLGHTRDDQAETIAFRLARQTGLDGLAGMAPLTHDVLNWQGQKIALARPLLSVSRAQLREHLKQRGQGWIDDPSNQNLAFTRVAIRHRLADLNAHQDVTSALVRIGEQARLLRDVRNAATDKLDHACRTRSRRGTIGLVALTFLASQPVIQTRLLARYIGALRPLSEEKLARLLETMGKDGFVRATLSGVMISLKSGIFWFEAAPARRNNGSASGNKLALINQGNAFGMQTT